jgi:hypothetical protein
MNVVSTAQQPVQLVELAALALPSDPAPLPFVPHAAAVEQEEALAAGGRPVAPVQLGDAFGRRLDERFIALDALLVGVGPVREQGEMQLVFRAREMVDLQALDLLFERLARRQQDRHGDQRAQLRRHAFAQREARQDRRAYASRDGAVHERHGGIDRRDHAEGHEHGQPGGVDLHLVQNEERQGENGRCDRGDRADIAAEADRGVEPARPAPHGGLESDFFLESATPCRDQVIARIWFFTLGHCFQCRAGDVELR